MIDSKLLRGSLDTIILRLLSEQDEMYGYEITQRVRELTSDAIQLTEGALYPALHRLEAKGILSADMRRVDNRIRKYYRITPEGNSEVKNHLAGLEDFINAMQLILYPKTVQDG